MNKLYKKLFTGNNIGCQRCATTLQFGKVHNLSRNASTMGLLQDVDWRRSLKYSID